MGDVRQGHDDGSVGREEAVTLEKYQVGSCAVFENVPGENHIEILVPEYRLEIKPIKVGYVDTVRDGGELFREPAITFDRNDCVAH